MKTRLTGKGFGNEVYAFHGTPSRNLDSILTNNLDLSKSKSGPGVWLSEFPAVSRGYGDALILFRLLQGQVGVDCRIVQPDKDNYTVETILQNPDQCLPCYVYHFN